MTKRPIDPGDFSTAEIRFARRVRKARKAAGLSQRALSDKTDLAVSYISEIENAARSPSLLTCMRLAEGLGVELATLVAPKTDDDPD